MANSCTVAAACVELPLFNACLLNRCCIVPCPCRQLRWKKCCSLFTRWNAQVILWQIVLRHTGVLYCSGNNKQPHGKRRVYGLEAQRTVLLEIVNRYFFNLHFFWCYKVLRIFQDCRGIKGVLNYVLDSWMRLALVFCRIVVDFLDAVNKEF